MFFMVLFSASIIGLSLGLLGAGGSILTVPVLMLVLGFDEKAAIASSLLIVAIIAATGMLNAIRQGNLQLKTLAIFALTSIPTSTLGAHIGLWLPAGLQTALLTLVMLSAAIKMFYTPNTIKLTKIHPIPLLLVGFITGLMTGLVGVGGGFLIVPALIIFAGLSMQAAAANSLALIATNATSAFLSLHLNAKMPDINWPTIATMAIVGACAALIGQHYSEKLNQQALKRFFAALLIIVATGLIIYLLVLT
jgi:uncharacterized membrane protein YfcA